jgi:hypothetical protein
MKTYQFNITTTAKDEQEARQIQAGLKAILHPSYRKQIVKLGTIGECMDIIEELVDKLKTKK